jgi:diacylglycerol kinase family enzyme
MSPPVAVILNDPSGPERLSDRLPLLLRESGIEGKVLIAGRGADITSMARGLLSAGYRTLVAAGGDGTVRAVAAAIVHTEAVLGVLPLGTLNHFAKDLKLPLGLEPAVWNLKTGVIHDVDVAEVNGRIFLNNSGLGLYPAMVTEREKRQRRGRRKWAAFFQACVATLRRYPFLDVRVLADGRAMEWRTPFVFVGNNIYHLQGIAIGTRDTLTEGVLCVIIAQYRIGRWGLVRLALRALFGRIRRERDFSVMYAKEVRITSHHKRVRVSLDGEVALLKTPLDYCTRPRALRVIVPE